METGEHTELTTVVATVVSEPSDTEVTTLTNMNDSYTCRATRFDNAESPANKLIKIRKYQMHTKTYSAKWEQDPNYQGWVERSKKGDGYYYCLACNQDYTCGKSELDKHASSRKHCMNMIGLNKSNNDQFAVSFGNDIDAYDVQTLKCDPFDNNATVLSQQSFPASSSTNHRRNPRESNEEVFGRFIINELKRIKRRKTYELVKGEILQALQKAMLKEVEIEDSES